MNLNKDMTKSKREIWGRAKLLLDGRNPSFIRCKLARGSLFSALSEGVGGATEVVKGWRGFRSVAGVR